MADIAVIDLTPLLEALGFTGLDFLFDPFGIFADLFGGVPRDAKTIGAGTQLARTKDPIEQYIGWLLIHGGVEGRVLSESEQPSFEEAVALTGCALIQFANFQPRGIYIEVPAAPDARGLDVYHFKPIPPPSGAPYSRDVQLQPIFAPPVRDAAAYKQVFGNDPLEAHELAKFLGSGYAVGYHAGLDNQLAGEVRCLEIARFFWTRYQHWVSKGRPTIGPKPPPPPPPGPGFSFSWAPWIKYVSETFKPNIDQQLSNISTPLQAILAFLQTLPQLLEVGDFAAIAAALTKLASCVCPELDKIAGELKTANELADVPKPLIDAIAKDKGMPRDLSQLLTGSPFSWVASVILGGAVGAIEKTPGVDSGGLWNNFIAGIKPFAEELSAYLKSIAQVVLKDVEAETGKNVAQLEQIAKNVINSLATAETTLPQTVFEAVTKLVGLAGEITPDNVEDTAFRTLGIAWFVGQGLHLLSALASYLGYPMSSVWGSNADWLVELLSYKDIIRSFHGPFFRTAITESARQRFARQFRPFIPSESIGFQMFARRKIDIGKLTTLVELNGVHKDWVDPLEAIAYRPVSPFILAAGFTNADIPTVPLRAAIENNGYSPADTDLTMQVVEIRSLQSVRQAYVDAAVSAASKGVIALTELDGVLDEAKFGAEAKSLVHKRVLLAQREATAAEVERVAISELKGNEVTAAFAAGQMRAAGIQDWRVNTTVALGAQEAALKWALKIETEERAFARKTRDETFRALVSQFERGEISAAVLTAGMQTALAAYLKDLEVLGAAPQETAAELVFGEALIAAQVAQAEAAVAGKPRFIYGLHLAPDAATLLKQRVAELEEAVIRADLPAADAHQQLLVLGIPEAVAKALADTWALKVAGKGAQPLGPGQPKFG